MTKSKCKRPKTYTNVTELDTKQQTYPTLLKTKAQKVLPSDARFSKEPFWSVVKNTHFFNFYSL